MKRTTITLGFFLILLCINNSTSQSIINGSFENTSGQCDYNLSNTQFSNLMEDCYGFGIASQIDIIDNNCNFGTAQNGDKFIGVAIASDDDSYDALSLKMDGNLSVDQSYTLSFHQRKDVGFVANKLEIGYSQDSLSFGYLIDTVDVATSSEQWDSISLEFTPMVPAKYITVRVIAGVYGWNLLDNFLLTANPTSTATSITNTKIKSYPNPCRDFIHLDFSTQVFDTILEIADISGKVMRNHRINNTHNFTLDVSTLNEGIYFLTVKNDSGLFTQKIIKK